MISNISILLLALTTQVIAGTATYGSLTYDTGSSNQFNMGDMLTLHNQARALNNVGPLVIDSRLFQAAVVHCKAMLSTGIFQHNANDGSPSERATAAGFNWVIDQENIYQTTQGTDASVATNAYLNSPPHRANIMNAGVSRAGFAVCGIQGGKQYWVSQLAQELVSTGDRFLVNVSSTAAPSNPAPASNPVSTAPAEKPVTTDNSGVPNHSGSTVVYGKTAVSSSNSAYGIYSKRSKISRG